jgi:hypothetical protein
LRAEERRGEERRSFGSESEREGERITLGCRKMHKLLLVRFIKCDGE